MVLITNLVTVSDSAINNELKDSGVFDETNQADMFYPK
jgi:hypothetical protein